MLSGMNGFINITVLIYFVSGVRSGCCPGSPVFMEDTEAIISFLESLPSFELECIATSSTVDHNIAEYYWRQTEERAGILNVLLESFDGEVLYRNCYLLLEIFLDLRNTFSQRLEALRPPVIQDAVSLQKGPGRPKINIQADIVSVYRDVGFSWNGIADMLGIHRNTLHRKRHEPEFQALGLDYSNISDLHLDAEIQSILSQSDRLGETMVRGALRAKGI